MENESIVFSLFLIFFGAAMIATLALTVRQSLIIAYIAVGLLIGPSGLSLIHDPTLIQNISSVGIIFLLFLLGLDLDPKELFRMAGETTLVTGISSVVLLGLGYFYSRQWGFTQIEALVIGSSLMFSSTIIGLKLIPTTVLHHQHTGELIISVLLLQDIIAIVLLLVLEASAQETIDLISLSRPLLALPLLVIVAYLVEKYVLIRLIRSYDKIQEYIFLLAIGWCLGVAEAAEWLGLSYEIGAFIAGVTIATSPIALFIVNSLKPLRDFFLIIFFVALGANFDLSILHQIWLPALGLALIAVLVKPLLYRGMLRFSRESPERSTEVAVRLGQMSEFSLLLAVLAMEMKLIQQQVGFLVQFATLLSFVISSTYVVMTYPTPIALNDRLRRD
ncbi:MAG: cation:proton antiporter [Gammaproteobacteria bacterium]|nr:cation:proton antiporter [Gammaproteobacteria bacterium]